uniref:Uncharacterized protein n=1 Tax=Neobodo designis TaxID=312471 RepID=A0A7S1MC49_NEODS|mmetsp:Transcript_37708/g.116512  ORF Transcript_37708/g.116512 Transcript_37708/m.116512 type:complete len:512 (+) Transcript_37708:173-1708(+)
MPTELIEGKVFCHPQGKGVFVVPRGSQRGPVWPRKLWPDGIVEPENGAIVKGEYQRNDRGGMIIRLISYSGSIPAPPAERPKPAAAAAPGAAVNDSDVGSNGNGNGNGTGGGAPLPRPATLPNLAGDGSPGPSQGPAGNAAMPKRVESWANLVRAGGGSPHSGHDDSADTGPGDRQARTATPSPSSPVRTADAGGSGDGAATPGERLVVADRVREAVPKPGGNLYQPRPDTHEERQRLAVQPPLPNARNHGFTPLDLMVQQLPQPFSLAGITKGFSRKMTQQFVFPSVPPVRYNVMVDPSLAKDAAPPRRMDMFPLCDKHAQHSFLGVGCGAGLETVCIRLSTDSAVMPAAASTFLGATALTGKGGLAASSSSGASSPSAGSANTNNNAEPSTSAPPPLFTRYMYDANREAVHHRLTGWLLAHDTPRVIDWLSQQMPAVLDLLVSGLGELCGLADDADLPDDVAIVVAVHLAEERVDCYAWSPSLRRQLGVCFERWFGDRDGFGRNPRRFA